MDNEQEPLMHPPTDLERVANNGADILARWFPDLTEDEDRVDLYRCAKAILMAANWTPPVAAQPTQPAMIGVLNETTGQIIGTYQLGRPGESKAAWSIRALSVGNTDTFRQIILYRKIS